MHKFRGTVTAIVPLGHFHKKVVSNSVHIAVFWEAKKIGIPETKTAKNFWAKEKNDNKLNRNMKLSYGGVFFWAGGICP